MAKEKTIKIMREEKRNEMVERLTNYFITEAEEVMTIASNAITIPFVHDNGEEDFYKIVISIPTGTKDDPFDGYAEAEAYTMKCEENKRKAEERERKKEEKKKKDEERRKKKEE